jgi:predicted dinucleotide-binding enzyme
VSVVVLHHTPCNIRLLTTPDQSDRLVQSGAFASTVLGARDLEKAKAAVAEKGKDLQCVLVAEALAAADVIVLAVRGAHDDDGIRAIAESLGDCR